MTRESESTTDRTPGSPPAKVPVGETREVLFSGDGRRIVFCFELGVWLLDAETGRAAPVIHRGVMGGGGAINEVGDRFVVVDWDAMTLHRVTVAEDGRTTNRALPYQALADFDLYVCALSPDGEWLVLGRDDGHVSILRWGSDAVSQQHHVDGCVLADFAPDSSAVWVNDAEGNGVLIALSEVGGVRSIDTDADAAELGFSSEDLAGDVPLVTRGDRALFVEGGAEREGGRDGYMLTVRTRSRAVVLGPPGGVPLGDVYDATLSWDGERVWVFARCGDPALDRVLVYDAESGDWLGFWDGLVDEESWAKLGTAPINPFGFDDGESVDAPAPAPRGSQGVAEAVEFDGHSSLLLARLASGVVGRADGQPLSALRFDDRDAGARAVSILAGLEAASEQDKVSPRPDGPPTSPRNAAEFAPTSAPHTATGAGEPTIRSISAEELAQEELLAIERTIATQEEAAPAPASTVWLRVVWVALALFGLWLLSR